MANAGGVGSARRGPRASRGVVRARVLAAARAVFAASGWKGTTLRDVADAAGVDPRTVAYYFTDRDQLLAAAIEPPADFSDGIDGIDAVPLAERGRFLIEAMLRICSQPEHRELLALIVAIGPQHPAALETLDAVHRGRVVQAIAQGLLGEDAGLRAGLAAGQLVAIAVARFVWRLEPLASLDDDSLVAAASPAVQHYLSGDLGLAT